MLFYIEHKTVSFSYQNGQKNGRRRTKWKKWSEKTTCQKEVSGTGQFIDKKSGCELEVDL